VVDKSDLAGSTEFIMKTIREAQTGSRWVIGTEFHLVTRLAREAAARNVSVRILSDCQCLCTTMFRIDQAHLCWVLDNLAAGKVVNRITVAPETRESALKALDRMLALSGGPGVQPAAAIVD
jgi:quinolinate synthase